MSNDERTGLAISRAGWTRWLAAVATWVVAGSILAACSSADGSGESGAGGGGAPSIGGASGQTAQAGSAGVLNAGGGLPASTPDAGSGAAGVNGRGGSSGAAGSSGASGAGGSAGVPPGDITLSAIGANATVGLEWPPVAGATGYRIYWSTSPGVTPANGQALDVARPDTVHRGLTNGTTYHYVIAAITSSGEGPPSAEATATPGGEWALERLGTGRFDDVLTGASVAPVPIEKRVHVLLFAEGYTAADLPVFHDEAHHAGDRRDDVDAWVDLVFGIEPYSLFSEAFVVWYLPRASTTQIGGGNTAFAVPVDVTSTPIMQSVPATGETATRAWQALSSAVYPPVDFYAGNTARARNHVASFLIFDPARGRASVSGLTTTLTNPANGAQRIGAAFGVGHAHEFTHAFSLLRDEYIETSSAAPTRTDLTSNVVPGNQCSTLPWAHLLVGSAINPATDGLVGAFGTPANGYHPELLCLLNGTHDNATHYGGSGLLRVEDRMCNFCREITAFRIFERTSVLPDTQTSFDAWQASYRAPFYSRFGFQVPAIVPQTNDVRNPAQGTPAFEACVP